MAASPDLSPFVGRADELDRLSAALDRVREGEPAAVCIGGEAGVGKSRLMAEFAKSCREADVSVLTGGCLELGEVSVPYAPIVQALRDLSRHLEHEALDQVFEPGRLLLGHLLPELGLTETEPIVNAAVGTAQARMFEAILGVVERLADQSPTVLVVEDLQWADGATLDLLTFLVRNMRAAALLILTYRTDELSGQRRLRPFLASMARSAGVERMELARFDLNEVTLQLAGLLGCTPDKAVAERVYRRSGGNAFFVEELSTAEAADDPDELSSGLEYVLLSRIMELAPETQSVLRMVAVAGGRVEHGLLAAVSGLPEAELLGALRQALEHQVLTVDGGGDIYTFRHALTHEALSTELLPGERTQLHAAFGAALSAMPLQPGDSDRLTVATRLAHHWSQAHDPERALPASIEAATRAAAAYGFEDAHRHFENAVGLWSRVTDPATLAGMDLPGLLQVAAETAYLAADPSRAIALTRNALEALHEAAEPTRAGLLHANLGDYLRATGGEDAIAEYQAAVRLVPASARAERARVLAALGESLAGAGRYRESRTMCEEAVATAAKVHSIVAEGDARRALGIDLAFLGNRDAGVRQLCEARTISRSAGRVDDVARAFASLWGVLDAFGEWEDAAATALEGAEFAAAVGLGRWHGPFLTAAAARAHFVLGHSADADVLLSSAADRVAPGLAATQVFINTARAEIDLARGSLDSAAGYLGLAREAYRRTVTQPWFAAPYFAAVTRLRLQEGRLDDAAAAVDAGTQAAGADPIFGPAIYALGLRVAAERAEYAMARRADDDLLAAHRSAEFLAENVAKLLSANRRAGVLVTPRVAALLAQCRAEHARATGDNTAALWEEAGGAWERIAAPHFVAYSRWRQAEAMLLSGGSQAEAGLVLRDAYLTATELDAVPLRREVEALARRGRLVLAPEASTATTPKGRGESPLDRLGITAREADVLSLIALGRTNRQIAQTLFISPKTAGVHVSSILAKLGVHSRVEAATSAHRLGVVPPPPG